MATATVTREPQPPPPPRTVTLVLDEEETIWLRALLGSGDDVRNTACRRIRIALDSVFRDFHKINDSLGFRFKMVLNGTPEWIE